MTTQPKRMLVHTYDQGKWSTKEYPSTREMRRSLRKEGIHFTQKITSHLGNTSALLIRDGITIEIEEAVERDSEIWFQDKKYISAKEYMKRTGKTWRQVHYAYDTGKLEGMKIGRRNYLYIRWEDES